MEMQQKSIQTNFQTLISSVEDFLVKHSQLLERNEALKTQEVECFLKLRELLNLKNLKFYYWKTLKGYSITTKGTLLRSSFKRFGKWGITLNGWFLTADFLEFPKIENECSLSQVLETNPDPRYYLSDVCKPKYAEYLKKNFKELQTVAPCIGTYNKLMSASAEECEMIRRVSQFTKEPRRLTPLECERCQGFPDNWTKHGLKEGKVTEIPSTARYKLIGNAVTVNVIKAIVNKLIKFLVD